MRLTARLLVSLLFIPLLVQGQISVGGDTTVCSDILPYQLFARPTGGVWTGSPAVDLSVDTGRVLTSGGILNPRRGLGTFVVTYTLGALTATKRITITDGPVADAGPDTLLCSGNTAQIIGRPAVPGLRYKWTRRLLQANGLDNDQAAQPNVTLTNSSDLPFDAVYYLAVTDPTIGCTSFDSVRVRVYKRTTGAIILPRLDTVKVCFNDSPFLLPAASPVGGFWLGSGIAPPDRYPGTFTPSAALEGDIQLTYNLPCHTPTTRGTATITVRVPRADAGSDREICANIDSIRLAGFPASGTWTGIGGINSGGLLIPDGVFIGTRTFTYTVFAGKPSCFATDDVDVTLKAFPITRPAGDLIICSNGDDRQLGGQSPAGGTFACRNCLPTNPSILNGDLVTPDKRNIGTWVVRYTVTEDGCTNFSESNVSIQPIDSAFAGRDTSVCSNASRFNLTGYGPTNGTWSGRNNLVSANGTVIPNPAITGVFNYIYQITSTNGCNSRDSIRITFFPSPGIPVARRDTAVCANDPKFNLIGSRPAGGRYFSSAGLDTVFGIDSIAGTFRPKESLIGIQKIYYVVRTPLGCKAKDSLDISVRSLPQTNAGVDFNVCSDADSIRVGSDTLPGNPPRLRYVYNWTGSQGTVGFSSINRANPKVKFSNTSSNPITRRYFYTIKREEQAQPTCSNRDTLVVTIFPKPVARTVPLLTDKICQGDSVVLMAETNPRLKYQWYTRGTILTPTPNNEDSTLVIKTSGTYFLRVFDSISVRGGVCADTSEGDSVFVKKRNTPRITGQIDFCADGRDSLHASPSLMPSLSYQWLRDSVLILGANDTVLRANTVGYYQVLITDPRFGVTCQDTSLPVFVDSIPTPYNRLVKVGTDTTFTVCSGSIPFILSGPIDPKYPEAFTYRWQDGSPNRFYTIDTIGVYFLSVSNQCGNATDTLRITEVIPTPDFTILPSGFRDTVVCKDIPLRFRAPLGNFYSWYYQRPDGSIDSLQTKNFIDIDTRDTSEIRFVKLRMTNPKACSYTDSMTYKISFCEPVVYIPTAFTPQGDNRNEKWQMKAYSVTKTRVYVYDRWGQQVYYGADLDALLNRPWDGTYKGQPCQQGVYKYIVEYEGLAPNRVDVLKQKKIGTVTLIR